MPKTRSGNQPGADSNAAGKGDDTAEQGSCPPPLKPKKRSPKARVKLLVTKVGEQLETQIDEKQGVKATLADYIRLLQLQKEMDEESPREVKVTWLEQPGAEERTGS